MVGQKAVHSLVDDVDPYEDAMRDDPDVGFHAFLPSKPQSLIPTFRTTRYAFIPPAYSI
jgi:hypothetical protein